ncbi:MULTISPECIES: hypothetical protein [Paenibacillus]|uniref:Copper amine oxidase domain-containing protein n=1 Tax=Paenibacillus illinoisensis TaxID=59845 RepID=A0A2W0C675_9BACL|nr:hypothetical protein [Paenibacillus illinoisensis]MBM6382910.1 hypothetical protein [Paenibacillus sp.]PYY27836.1 Copper amine oxidase domain-containing protein [Paenibacillus illinoisensis]
MKTWTGILLMIVLAVVTISTTSAVRTSNEPKQLNIDDQSSQTDGVVASNIETNETSFTSIERTPVKKENVSVAPENEKVRLYPMQVEGSGYIYNGMILEVNGQTREFSKWQGEGGSYKPEVHELDLNGDGKKEIIVLFTAGHGTGIYLGQAHIIDPDTLEEMNMQPLDEVVKQHIQSKVNVTPGKVNIEVALDGVKLEPSQIEEETDGIAYHDELQFGDVVYYSVENGKLEVTASGAYGPAGYDGDLTFAYAYQDGEWKAENVEYRTEAYEDEYYESFD